MNLLKKVASPRASGAEGMPTPLAHAPLSRAMKSSHRNGWRLLVACGVVLLGAVVTGVAVGAVTIPPEVMWQLIASRLFGAGELSNTLHAYGVILFDIRLPRVALMSLAGAALSAAGAAYQGLFRNPLADPYLVGVASGAGLGATAAITLGLPHSVVGLMAVPLGAFIGGIMAVAVVLAFAHVGRSTPITTLLLAGVAIGSFASAITTFWMLRSPDGLRRAFNWMLGGYTGAGWEAVWAVLPYVGLGLLILQLHAHALNVLQFDEEQARLLGLNVERVRLTVVAAATLMTAAAVAFGGLIGFVGLIVPHILRMIAGADHRRLIVLSSLGGASFLILADVAARTALAPQEIPVGVITAMLGTPFFIYLLRKIKRAVF